MKQVAVVIINFRTPALTVESLRSLTPDMEGRNDRCAVVVDNFSEDNSVAEIRAAIDSNGWNEWARVIESPVNGGFCVGNNVGMAAEEAEFYLLLNSDAMVLPGAIDTMLGEMDRDSGIGLVGPRLQWENGKPQISCFRYVSPMSEFLAAAKTGPLDRLFSGHVVACGVFEKTMEPQWLSFACVLIRGKMRDEIGGMDEGYFLYFDDIDYCRRAHRAGWKVLHAPNARAIHLRGGTASLKKDTAARRRLPRYIYESRARYFAKFHGGMAGVLRANLMWSTGRLISFLRETIGGKEPHTSDRQFRDNWINWNVPMRASSYMPWLSKK